MLAVDVPCSSSSDLHITPHLNWSWAQEVIQQAEAHLKAAAKLPGYSTSVLAVSPSKRSAHVMLHHSGDGHMLMCCCATCRLWQTTGWMPHYARLQQSTSRTTSSFTG